MKWTRVEQVEKHLLLRSSKYGANFNGHVFRDRLLLLVRENKKKGDMVCCWAPGL